MHPLTRPSVSTVTDLHPGQRSPRPTGYPTATPAIVIVLHCPEARPIPPSNAVALALDVPTPGATNPVSFSNEREPKQRVDSPIGSARCAVLYWSSQRCRL